MAHCNGLSDLPLSVVDPGKAAPVYARCIEWCREASVTEPADLAGRIVSHERYEAEWVERCHALDCY